MSGQLGVGGYAARHIYVVSDGVAHKCALRVDSNHWVIPACVAACKDGAIDYRMDGRRSGKMKSITRTGIIHIFEFY